ncbi:unnamed protein product [Ectocarpus sp. 12 AP-2014]
MADVQPQELEKTQPSMLDGSDSEVPGELVFSDNHICKAGNLFLLDQKTESPADKRCPGHCFSRGSPIPSALEEKDLMKASQHHHRHYCHVALTTEGELLTWSSMASGGRQDGRTIAATTSQPFFVMDRFRDVHSSRSAARGDAASDLCAGDCTYGSSDAAQHGWAGCPNTGSAAMPTVWQVLAQKPNVTDVACGQEHTLALLETGQVFSWGNGYNGRLGLGDTRDRSSACHIEALQGIEIEAVFCGVSHSLAVCSTGTSYAWGKNDCGQCGDTDPVCSDAISPRSIDGLKNFPVSMMAGGWGHSLALTRRGELFSFGGSYSHGRDGDTPTAVLGISAAAASATVANGTLGKRGGVPPTRVCTDSLGSATVKAITSGWDHCMAVTDDGTLFTWGSGRHGQLGHEDAEPRHSPTRVAFFATLFGGRIRSATGGRTYSAAVTVDGRVFKWGLERKFRPPRRSATEGGSSSRGHSPSEEDEVTAAEASVPRLVIGDGVEEPRAVRLSEGGEFGVVLAELRPVTGHDSSSPRPYNEAERRGHSTSELLEGTGLDVPDDPSQPVGRIEMIVALLRHFERLAIPHIPKDTTVEVDRSLRQAVRVGKRIRKRVREARTAALVSSKHDQEVSTTSSANRQQLHTTREDDIPNDEQDSSKHAPMCSVGNLHESQEAIVSRTRSPIAPFCVDTSWQAFRSFLDLIRVVRERKSPMPTSQAREPAAADTVDSVGVLMGKSTGNPRSDSDNTGPEGCGKLVTGSVPTAEPFDKQARMQGADLTPETTECVMASRSVQMEVLRGTLSLLKVNLFQFVRVAAMRCACGGNRFFNPSRKARTGDNGVNVKDNDFQTKHNDLGVQDEDGFGSKEASCAGDGGTTIGQKRCRGSRGSVEDLNGVIGELHAELQNLLEDEVTQQDPETTAKAQAVQVEAAEAFRIGFSVFFRSNLARVKLLQDVVIALKTAGPVSLEQTQRPLDDKGKDMQSPARLQQRVCRAPRSNTLLRRLAVEGLARDNYASAIVSGTFNRQRSEDNEQEDSGTAIGEAAENFDATKLDAVMQSVLSYCADDLQKRLWGGSVASEKADFEYLERPHYQSRTDNERRFVSSEIVRCPYSRLLLVLQEHVIAYWGDADVGVERRAAARGLSLTHASRLLEESQHIFSRLLMEWDQTTRSAHGSRSDDVLKNSFVELLPALCISITSLPTEGEDCLARAAALLPLVLPLMGAVDRFNGLRISTEGAATPVGDEPSQSDWSTQLEEALARLSSDLVCSLIDMNSIKTRQPIIRRSHETGCDRERDWGEEDSEELVEMLLASSPFLAFGRETFGWSDQHTKDGPSRLDSPVFSQALKVIELQEGVTKESCGCSTLKPTTPNPTPSKLHPQNSLARGRRRASNDNAALNPIDARVSPHGLPGHANRGSTRGGRGSKGGGAGVEAEENGGRSGGAPGRQLDSIVDDARAEGFLNDLLCGQGAALSLYQWMIVPPDPQLPVLHATSLATQGQGWGSYQSLNSHPVPDQQDSEGSHRRRRSRALPSDVDAATRALVAVIIKSNGVVTEAATFARCRLDRASSPPRTLKLIASAAAEVREVLAGLADSLEGDKHPDLKFSSDKHDHQNEEGGAGRNDQGRAETREKAAATGRQPTAETLTNIVRNCRLLLKHSTRLPSIDLARRTFQSKAPVYRRERSASRLPSGDRQTRRELSQALRRWATDARRNSSASPRGLHHSPDEGSTADLVLIMQHMTQGRVKEALSAAMVEQKSSQPPGSTSLESLVAFATNPIPLWAIEARMRLHELRAKVRASGLRLVHFIVNQVRIPSARRQINARLARSLGIVGGGVGKPSFFDGIGAGGNVAIVRERSAFFDLFRHVVYEVIQEHSGTQSKDGGKTRSSTSLLVFLSLLRTLAMMMTPRLLHYSIPTSPFAQHPDNRLANGEPGSAPSRPGAGVPAKLARSDKQGRSVRASSCPSVASVGASELKPSLDLDQESISAVVAAISVLGSILSGQGDALAHHTSNADSMKRTVHHAAWRALSVVTMQLCSSSFSWATHKHGGASSLHHSRPASSPKERGGPWTAIQATLVLVHNELTRARGCLEQLQQTRRDEEEALVATGAVRLVSGPVSVPVSVTGLCTDLREEDGNDGCGLSFWVWGPSCTTIQHPGKDFDKSPRERCSSTRSDALDCGSRRTLVTHLCKASSPKTCIGIPGSSLGIFLSRRLPHNKTGTPDDDVPRVYIEMAAERRDHQKNLDKGNSTQGEGLDGRGRTCALAPTPGYSTADGQDEEHKSAESGDGSMGEEFERESLFSECPLPPGQWTHVTCSAYSNTRGGGAAGSSLSGASTSSGGRLSSANVRITFNGRVVATRVVCSSQASCTTKSRPPSDQSSKHGEGALGDRHQCLPAKNNRRCERDQGENASAVFDLHWHPREVSPDRARQMADIGVPAQRENSQRAAESYVARLVALTKELTTCSLRVAAMLSTPRWLFLWFDLESVAGHHVRRAIMRLLRLLLCIPSQAFSERADGERVAPKALPGSPPPSRSCANDFSDRAIVKRLCESLDGMLMPSIHCHRSDRVLVAGRDAPNRELRQDSSMVSEIILLFRSLVKEVPDRWREHVFAALTDGLATFAKGEFSGLPKSAAGELQVDANRDDRSSTWLGAAAAAAYLGGGHIEGLHVGARVVLLPRTAQAGCPPKQGWDGAHLGENVEGLLREKLGDVCMSAETPLLGEEAVKSACCGTVVGWMKGNESERPTLQDGVVFVAVDDHHRDCIEEVFSNNPSWRGTSHEAGSNSGLTIAVRSLQISFHAEATEIVTPFFFQKALPSILTFLGSPIISRGKVAYTNDDEKEPRGDISNEIGLNVVEAHLRCRLIRALAVQLSHVDQAGAALRTKVIRPLMALGGSTLASAVVLALGSDDAVAFGRRSDFSAVLLSLHDQRLASDNSLLSELESACQIVWSRICLGKHDERGHRPRHRSPRGMKGRKADNFAPSVSRPTLQVIGGDALVEVIEGNRVTASSHFPTVRLSHVGVGLRSTGGRWYYEVTLLTGGLMQVGWAGPLFQCSPTRGQGVGDHMHSWAFDGFRQKRWCVSSAPYGERWRAGDVVGVLLDTGLQEMRFSLNGRDLGVAFAGFEMGGLYPAASMNVGQGAHFNFGHAPFLFPPTRDGGSSLQPVSEALAANDATRPNSADSGRSCQLPVRGIDGEDAENADDGDEHHREVSLGRVRGTNVAVGTGDGQGFSTSDEGGQEREGEDVSQLQIERQGLVENLVAMGFPLEWAIRAAGKPGPVMSESAATAWIIDRLEIENTKMEEEMGTMESCEEDSNCGNSGIGDEYNDAGESEDGDADTGGFVFASDAAGVERQAHENEVRNNEESGDRRWHDMYSAVRRGSLARNIGASPATAVFQPSTYGPGASITPGTVAEAGRTGSKSTSSPTTLPFLAEDGQAMVDGLRSTSYGIKRVAMITDERDLPSLSRVLETALSILLARAAVVNLFSHITAASGTWIPRCHSYVLAARFPSLLRANGPGDLVSVREGIASPSPVRDPWMGGWGGAGMAIEVVDGILQMLAVEESHRSIVDITKVFATWYVPSRSTQTGDVLSIDRSAAATGVTGRNGSTEDCAPGVCFKLANVTDAIGQLPRSYFVSIRSLIELLVASLKSRDEWKTWTSAKRLSEKWTKDHPTPSSSRSFDVARAARMSSLIRLLTLFINEAISAFETGPVLKNVGSTSADKLNTDEQKAGRVRGTSVSEVLSFRSNFSWALWVLDTMLKLESAESIMNGPSSAPRDGRGPSTEPIRTTSAENESTSDDGNLLLPEVPSARSPQAFGAVLRTANSNNVDESLKTLAYTLCSNMLTLSRPAKRMFPGSMVSSNASHGTTETCLGSPEGDEYTLPPQELALARAFSARLRSQISAPGPSSSLLQSQLELLAQWELRRSIVDGRNRPREEGWDLEKTKDGAGKPPSPEGWVHTGQNGADTWDVTTGLFAGAEGGGDGFEIVPDTNSRAAGRGRRVGTAESETSLPSGLHTPPFSGALTPAHNNSLLVEAVSATSVTVSWGDWFENGGEPELQVWVGGDGVALPAAFDKAPRASDLAQALRSKLKRATNRRRDEGPSMVLLVSASGLWGSEPFHVAALDLDGRGCLKVHGLAADTRYSFRLERRKTCPSRASPSVAADLSDDERSCFPAAATVGANSTGTGGSSSDPLGADVADGASALTGIDGSHGGGGGGTSTCSEGCATVFTDESRCCTSSTRAVAGINRSPSAGGRYVNKHSVDEDEFRWPSAGDRGRFCGTSEEFVLGRANGAFVAAVNVATPPEVPFMLDAEGCGPNLRLTNSNLTVTNTGRKKWSAVRATRGFTCGSHRWKVRIDRQVFINVFVGVVSSASALNNYVGSDRSGWGYLANKAIWHNKGKVRSYGDLFREGDTIETILNMDLGTLRFARNGRDLGMAVQGLEGTLFPAFSMYNRNDQLTFIPPEDHASPPPVPFPGSAAGDKNGGGPTRVGGGMDVPCTYSKVLYGTFSAECVVRRAAKALQLLETLNDQGKLATSSVRADLMDDIRSRLLRWSRGEHGRSVASVRPWAPVRLDTSEQARRDLFGLGVGDRVLSAEGEATVLGATRHALWVAVEATSSASACTPGLSRGSRVWGSELPDNRYGDAARGFPGNNTPAATSATVWSPSHQRFVGKSGSKITAWSRRTVRQIASRPEDYVISRHTTPADSVERLGTTTNVDDDRDSTGQHQTAGEVAVVDDFLRTDEARNVLSRWTPKMDEELGRHLIKLADTMEVATPLDLPFNVLEKLPSSTEMFPGTDPVAPAEIWARTALLLYVNDLVLPLLPLISTTQGGRGPLGTLIHKFRHLIFKTTKLELLGNAIRPITTASSEFELGNGAPAFTIPLIGVKSLPRFPAKRLNAAKPCPLSWGQTRREVEKSVFGQVARHLSHSRGKHVLSEGPLAFSVELVDASKLADDESGNRDCLQMSDARALYQGVFWQVCEDVCSSPISMFVRSPSSPADEASLGASDPTAAANNDSNVDGVAFAANTLPRDHVRDTVPNPYFTSRGLSPVCMDPERVSLYRSFGFIVGVAVRTGVPLPLSHLSSQWWMLVSNGECPSAVTESAPGVTRTLADSSGTVLLRSNATKEAPPQYKIDGVLSALSHLVEAGLKQEEMDEVLADARFVAPLSSGNSAELVRGGLDRRVTNQNLGEYRARLARLRASEYASQAAAFRAGMEAALPNRVLSLLTWRELEQLVCG